LRPSGDETIRLSDLVEQFDQFMEANKRAVRSLGELGKMFAKISLVTVRRNEPFNAENIRHRCRKKRHIEAICHSLSRRLLGCMAAMDALVESYHLLSRANKAEIDEALERIKNRFLSHFWFLQRILLFNLSSDVTYFSQHKRALGLLIDIRPSIMRSILSMKDQGLVPKLRSLNELVRYIHQRGENAFFIRARQMGASAQFALGSGNCLNLVDLDVQLSSGGADDGTDRTLSDLLREPVMAGLLQPYREGIKGEGAETLNVVKFKETIDTQLELGLHKARLRSRIPTVPGATPSSISLSYYEPFQTLVSQTLGQRVRYLSGILSRLLFSVDTDFVTYLNAQFDGAPGKCRAALGELVRAMISLKDLDELLSQPGKTEHAISLFAEGVSNIHGYFNAVRCLDLALNGEVSPESLSMILGQEELSPKEMSILLHGDFAKLIGRPGVDATIAETIRSVLTSQMSG